MPSISRKARLLQETLQWAASTTEAYQSRRWREDQYGLDDFEWETRLNALDVDSGDDSSHNSTASTSSLSGLSSDSSSDVESDESDSPSHLEPQLRHALLELELVAGSDGHEEEDLTRFLGLVDDFLAWAQTTRVLFPNIVHKTSQLQLVLVLYKEDDPDRFCLNLRVSPSTFDTLLERIEDNPIFHNNSNNKQFPVMWQLAITLYRFGHYGNGASVQSVAQWAGVSEGVVVKCTRRVMTSVLALHDRVIRWPTTEEKEEAKTWVESESCDVWRNGYCFVDGTLIPLSQKPGLHGDAYFDRKSNYSLNLQVCFVSSVDLYHCTQPE